MHCFNAQLGNVVNHRGRDTDRARGASIAPESLWKLKDLTSSTKLINVLVRNLSMLTLTSKQDSYGSKTCRTTTIISKKLQTFIKHAQQKD